MIGGGARTTRGKYCFYRIDDQSHLSKAGRVDAYRPIKIELGQHIGHRVRGLEGGLEGGRFSGGDPGRERRRERGRGTGRGNRVADDGVVVDERGNVDEREEERKDEGKADGQDWKHA